MNRGNEIRLCVFGCLISNIIRLLKKKLILIILCSIPLLSSADNLKKDEAFIVSGLLGGINITAIKFKEYTTENSFMLNTHTVLLQLKIIKAGNYYLSNIMPFASNILPITLDKPKTINETFKIIPGTVTYIGFWNFEEAEAKMRLLPKWEFNRGYPEEDLIRLIKENGYLINYPLIISTDKGELFKHDWKKVINKNSMTP